MSTTLEDKTLVQGALAGQTEYFSVLMYRHAGTVRNCIRAMVRDTSDVEDLVQDTFLKAWKHLSAFRFESSFRTWVVSVALNEALALHRRRNYRPSCVPTPSLDALPSQSESPDQVFTRSETHIRIHSAVAKLPTKYRQVLMLCDLQQLTMRETADRIEAKVSLVKTRLFRARRMLALTLTKEVSSRGWAGTRSV
jgi:RNA polymerase sigma-70 factor, ECF subfamily